MNYFFSWIWNPLDKAMEVHLDKKILRHILTYQLKGSSLLRTWGPLISSWNLLSNWMTSTLSAYLKINSKLRINWYVIWWTKFFFLALRKENHCYCWPISHRGSITYKAISLPIIVLEHMKTVINVMNCRHGLD